MTSLLCLRIMEASKENQKCYIFTHFKLGNAAKQVCEDLLEVFPDAAVSYSSRARWVRSFDNGNESLLDEHWSRAPESMTL